MPTDGMLVITHRAFAGVGTEGEADAVQEAPRTPTGGFLASLVLQEGTALDTLLALLASR